MCLRVRAGGTLASVGCALLQASPSFSPFCLEHSLNKPVLSTYCVPGPMVGPGDSAIKKTAWALALMSVSRADSKLHTNH